MLLSDIPWSAILTMVISILTSQGIWALISAKSKKRSAQSLMILGLGHDRIMYLTMQYIQRGYVTDDEYENLSHYLYEPYELMGGNGTAAQAMIKVRELPLYPSHTAAEEHKAKEGHY